MIYVEDEGDYIVVASKGGAPEHPEWYQNSQADPEVRVQVGDRVMAATADTAEGARREVLWSRLVQVWPDFDEYARKTDREIPVVVLTPTG